MKTIKWLPALMAFFFLASCTTTPQMTAREESGFLSDYTGLKIHKTNSDAQVWRWVSPNFEEGRLSQLHLEPLAFHPAPAATDQVSIDAINKLGDELTASVRESALTHQIPMADKPSEQALILRAALTTVELKNKKFKLGEIIPIRLIWSATELALGKRDKDVTVILEYEFIDGKSGESLIRGVRQDNGIPVVNSKTQFTLDNAKPILKNLLKDLDSEFKRLKQALLV